MNEFNELSSNVERDSRESRHFIRSCKFILHQHLDRKLSTRWVPHLLTIDQKRVRMTISLNNVQTCLNAMKKFSRRFISIDETWIHHYTTMCYVILTILTRLHPKYIGSELILLFVWLNQDNNTTFITLNEVFLNFYLAHRISRY